MCLTSGLKVLPRGLLLRWRLGLPPAPPAAAEPPAVAEEEVRLIPVTAPLARAELLSPACEKPEDADADEEKAEAATDVAAASLPGVTPDMAAERCRQEAEALALQQQALQTLGSGRGNLGPFPQMPLSCALQHRLPSLQEDSLLQQP